MHQKPSGEAAWIRPHTTPHSTGARKGCAARGPWVRVIAGSGGWRPPGEIGGDGGCAGQGEQGGGPPRPRRAGEPEVAGGAFDGFGGDAGGGPAGMGGEVARHRVEAERAVRLWELDIEATPGRPPGEPRAGEPLDQPQGAEHARGHPGGGGDVAVLDV